MKKKLLIIIMLCFGQLAMAKYEPWNYNMVQVSLFSGNNAADGTRGSVDDIYAEMEGFHRHDLLDLYWFNDFFDISNSGSSDMHGVKPSIYGEFNPRISLDGLLGKDLSIGRFNEWFLSYQFDYDNGDYKGGLRRHQIGIGSYFDLEKFDYVRVNLFARYATKSYGKPNENKWDGYLFNVAYMAPLYTFENGWVLSYSGWIDYVFGAKESEKYNNSWNNTSGTDNSLQWFNQLKLQIDNFGVSASVKVNHSFTEVNNSPSNSSDSTQYILGVHYKF
ncbi:MAG: outer membrane protein OmpK [Fusobacterium sp. JB021]|nr:outer membrane protein OmpK [Fusobacterium sp. JB020]MDP0494077.1 outer membrane protein OmpK [Fusobacterium sp. JB021]MDP0506061.1 outer membrane protein OmpK [Fusobacterium sp. JB019]